VPVAVNRRLRPESGTSGSALSGARAERWHRRIPPLPGSSRPDDRFVEVRLFADRPEVWNPGSLPGTLTPESLSEDHPSIPNNPLIAESLHFVRYIEKAGSGRDIPQPKPEECDSGRQGLRNWNVVLAHLPAPVSVKGEFPRSLSLSALRDEHHGHPENLPDRGFVHQPLLDNAQR